jgi:hypothetical protein
MPVVSLIKENDLIAGAVIRDLETGQEHQIRARAVTDAAGFSRMVSARWVNPAACLPSEAVFRSSGNSDLKQSSESGLR